MPLFTHYAKKEQWLRWELYFEEFYNFLILDTYLRAGITRRDSDQSTMTSAFQYSAKALHRLAGSVFGKPVSRPLWHALTTNGISRVQPTRRGQRDGTDLCRPIAVIVSAFRCNCVAYWMTAPPPTWTCYAAQLQVCPVTAQRRVLQVHQRHQQQQFQQLQQRQQPQWLQRWRQQQQQQRQ